MTIGSQIAALGLVAACEDPKEKAPPAELTGDTTPTVAEIKHWLAQTRAVEVAAVECPPTVPVRQGYAFECRATLAGGGEVPVVVEFMNRSGNLRMRLRHPIAIASEIEAQIRGDAGTRRVDCGERVREVQVGMTFTCKVHQGAVTEHVEVRVTNASGGVRWRFLDRGDADTDAGVAKDTPAH